MRACLQGEVLEGRDATEVRHYWVTAISAGMGNGLEYSEDVLAQSVALFEGATVFVDHAQMEELSSVTGGRSLRRVLGVLEQCQWSASVRGVQAVLRVYPGPDAAWFCAMVDQYLADRAAGRSVPRVGLSAVIDVQVHGKQVLSIERVLSVDAVFDPARGGEFVRAMNQQEEEGTTDYADCTYYIRMHTHRGDCTSNEHKVDGDKPQIGGKTSVEGDMQATRTAATDERGQETAGAGSEVSLSGSVVERKPLAQTTVPARSAPEDGTAQCVAALTQSVLELRLGASGLPAPLQDVLRKQFMGRAFEPAELDTQMETLRAAWAASLTQSGAQVRGLGQARAGGRWQMGLDETERLQAVMDRLCGLTPQSELLQGVRPVGGIRELYLMLTGDYEFRGGFDPDRVALANVTSSTMTSLVKNAFNKVIVDYFAQAERWWEPIVSEESLDSMHDLTLVTLGGFAELPAVTEGDAYTELEWSDTEESVAFVKHGAFVGVTLEMMDKDKTRAFRSIPRRLAVAGYRSLSGLIGALFTSENGYGPYWPSSQAIKHLFDNTYANVTTNALSAASWDACIQAMYKQMEANSEKRMGLRPSWLVVPVELEKTALTILQSLGEPGTADNDVNVRRGSSRVVVCPEFTDVNDWAAVADPRVWPAIVVGYRFGRVPEVFVAGDELAGSMFTNDELRIKARFVVAVGVADYRPLYRGVVA